ncbi:MAG: polyprenyl synthetase family protein [Firmicutes bacterium]|nr:polyprenyl synthetase family protein [Bacillota bacterium]
MVIDLQLVYGQAQRELAAVDEKMRQAVNTLSPTLREAAEYALAGGGKRLRPLMTILTAKLGEAAVERVVPAAAALELVHLGSLVHDDIVDESAWRRSQPSVNAKYGNKVAVLLGDFFFARALDLARQVGLDAVQSISRVISNLVEGELEQLRRSYDTTITEEEYWERIQRKTASFIAECCRLGAIYSQDNPLAPETLHAYGLNLGLAYQVKDDLLDFTGKIDTVGKPTQRDLTAGVLTLPVIHTLQHHPRRQEIAQWIAGKDYDWTLVINCMQEVGSFEFAQTRAEELIATAKNTLAAAPEREAKTALLSLADYVLTRVS